MIDKELICSSRLDIKRPDVNRAHSLKGNHGFKLSLPSQISNLEFKSPPRLLAMNVDGSIQIDLKL